MSKTQMVYDALLKSDIKHEAINVLAKELTKEANVSMAVGGALAEGLKWNYRWLFRAHLAIWQMCKQMIVDKKILSIANVKLELLNVAKVQTLIESGFKKDSACVTGINVSSVSQHAVKDQLQLFFKGCNR